MGNLEISNQKILDKCISAGLAPPKQIDSSKLSQKLIANCGNKKADAELLGKGITKKASNLKLHLDKILGTYEENVCWTEEGRILVLQEIEICGPEFDAESCRLAKEDGNQLSLSHVRD